METSDHHRVKEMWIIRFILLGVLAASICVDPYRCDNPASGWLWLDHGDEIECRIRESCGLYGLTRKGKNWLTGPN